MDFHVFKKMIRNNKTKKEFVLTRTRLFAMVPNKVIQCGICVCLLKLDTIIKRNCSILP